MIKLTNVEKFYEAGPTRTWVLRRISAEIRDGEFVTIMGPSGAGKSTLMAIIGMLDGAWRGEYYLLGNAVHKLDNRRRVELHKQYVGFVFQQYHLLDNLTVAANRIARDWLPMRSISSRLSARRTYIPANYQVGNNSW